jgi:hypothetical protein
MLIFFLDKIYPYYYDVLLREAKKSKRLNADEMIKKIWEDGWKTRKWVVQKKDVINTKEKKSAGREFGGLLDAPLASAQFVVYTPLLNQMKNPLLVLVALDRTSRPGLWSGQAPLLADASWEVR